MSESSRIDLRRLAMAKSYSVDLRKRVLAAISSGSSARSAAKFFSVSASSAVKWAQRWRSSGQVEASPVRGHRRSPLVDHADWLLSLIAGQADLTLEEIHERIGERGVSTSVSSLWRFFDGRGISFKKKRPRERATAPRRRPRAGDLAAKPIQARSGQNGLRR
jgi:transposase